MPPNAHDQDPTPAPHSASPHPPSLFRRLSTTVPDHTSHILDKLFSPNKTMYSLPHNDPHEQHPPPAPPSIPESAAMPPKHQRRVSFSIGAWREKQVKGAESEVAIAEEEIRRQQRMAGEKEMEFGVPLCREGEIEKWKLGKEGERRKRRLSWH